MKARSFDFPGRPSRRAALEIIRAALADEGLAMGQPGQASVVRTVITADGLYRVIVPGEMMHRA